MSARAEPAPVAPADLAASERPSFLYRPVGIWSVRLVAAVAVLGGWQLTADHMSRALNAPPTEIAKAFWAMAHTHALYGALWSSVEALILGFLLAMVIGVPVGIAMGRWRSIEHVLDPYVSFLYALPHVVFIPAMVVWFGFQLKLRLLYVLVSAVWPFIINAMTGVQAIDSELLATAKSFCANERQVLRTIIAPATASFTLAGVRQALPLSWYAVVVAEVLSTQTGLGGLLTVYGEEFRNAYMFVPVILIAVIAVLVQFVAATLQSRLTPWSNAERR